MGWLSGYLYRKAITLTGGSDGAQTDFQLKLAAAFVTDHMQSDFDDLRFTDADGETLIDAWLEDKTDGTSADVWVEFPSTPADGETQTYYMYYGKADAVDYWDIGETFLFGDDFPGASPDTSKWTVYGTVTVSGGIASGSTSLTDGLFGKTIIPINTKTIIKIKPHATNVDARPGTEQSYDNPYLVPGLGWQYHNTGDLYSDTYSTAVEQVDEKAFTTDWHIIETRWVNGSVKFYEDTTTLTEHTTYVPDNSYTLYDQIDGDADYDYIFSGKYTANPPTYEFGSEENAPTGLSMAIVMHHLMQMRRS